MENIKNNYLKKQLLIESALDNSQRFEKMRKYNQEKVHKKREEKELRIKIFKKEKDESMKKKKELEKNLQKEKEEILKSFNVQLSKSDGNYEDLYKILNSSKNNHNESKMTKREFNESQQSINYLRI